MWSYLLWPPVIGCQRMIPLVLPEVTTMVQKLLARGFPRAYRERLEETEPELALVAEVIYICKYMVYTTVYTWYYYGGP